MKKEHINIAMDTEKIIYVMSVGNLGATICIRELVNTYKEKALFDLLVLDNLGIYGSKIYILWNDCCNGDVKTLHETIQAFSEDKFTSEAILENLNKPLPLPFKL